MRTIEDLARYLREIYLPKLAQISSAKHEIRLEERELRTLRVSTAEVPADPDDFSRDDECLRHKVIYFLPEGAPARDGPYVPQELSALEDPKLLTATRWPDIIMHRGGGEARMALEPGRWMLVVADNVRHEQSEATTGSSIALGAFRLEGGLGVMLWDPAEKQTLCDRMGLDALPSSWLPTRVRWGS